MTEGDFNYADWLLSEWARWVKSEYIGEGLGKGRSGLAPTLDDETGLSVDMAIARCEPSVRKLIKRVYLWRDISISKEALRAYLKDFMRAFYRDAA
ncbi:hypothetical protein M2318_004860 [Metapseudomonas resinovorans]|uniref:hypothetical protein n=1 Tax=Metapseudomonas resinovorans TaxID=53412 RepID=UPI003D207249